MVPFLVCIGLVLFWLARSSCHKRQRVLATAVASTATALPGPVALSGVARGDPPQAAPVTGTICAYWEAEIFDYWQYRRDHRAQWAVAAREAADCGWIWLEDAAGRLPILLHGATWSFAKEDEFDDRRPPPPAGRAFVDVYGLRWGADRLKLMERRIAEGDPIHVIGTLARAGEALDGIEASRRALATRLLAELDALARRSSLRPRRNRGSREDRDPLMFEVGAVSGSGRDPAVLLRDRLHPNDLVVWCGRNGLSIGNRDATAMSRQMGWVAAALTAAAWTAMLLALALALLAIAAW